MTILGVETSCDETALALIEIREKDGCLECRVIDSLVHSQADLHSAYGGVYPSLAKREHGRNLIPLLHRLLSTSAVESRLEITESDFDVRKRQLLAEIEKTNPDLLQTFEAADFLRKVPAIDHIAVTEGPGLEPTLWVGINFAKILGELWKIPVVPVNHMEGHIVGSLLDRDAPQGAWQVLKNPVMPALAFLISGGHTELVEISASGKNAGNRYKILGETRDDAVGEAFDKVARLLGLPYPGGPHVSKLAFMAREKDMSSNVKLPRPMISSADLNFSFSGLKTAVLYAVQKATAENRFDENFRMALAREFEDAVAETLEAKLEKAIEERGAGSLIVGGGVSANRVLRERFQKIAAKHGLEIYLPSQHISGDNALMIALAGALEIKAKSGPQNSGPLKAHGTKRLDGR